MTNTALLRNLENHKMENDPEGYKKDPEESLDYDKVDLSELKFFTKNCKLGKGKKVPIRRNGMTGSGKKNYCHINVSRLVHNYGGSDVRGYYVVYHPSYREYLFNPHSVWKTPEGELCDVSLNSGKGEFITFFPLYECHRNEGYNYSNTQIYVPTDVTAPITISVAAEGNHGLSSDLDVCVTRKEVKRGQVDLNIFWGFEEGSFLENHRQVIENFQSFTKPSTATGKYFELRDAA